VASAMRFELFGGMTFLLIILSAMMWLFSLVAS